MAYFYADAAKGYTRSHLYSPFAPCEVFSPGISTCSDASGKLHDLVKIMGFFARLKIPFHGLGAPFISTPEFVVDILLMLNLLLPPVGLPLPSYVLVAYSRVDRAAFTTVSYDPGEYYVAHPVLFAPWMFLIFGAGFFAVVTMMAERAEAIE